VVRLPVPASKPTSLVAVRRDEDIAAGLTSLDPVAWRQLFDEHFDAVYHYAQLRTGSPIIAGDIASATLLAAAKHGTDFGRRQGAYVAHLLDIADRALGQEQRRARSDSRNGLRDVLGEAIAGLNGEQRDVIVLRLIEGHDVQRVATALHIRPGAVKSREMRALHHLCRDHGALPPDGTRHAETILDAWIDRLLRGEPLEDILGTPAMRSIDLLPMLRMANAIVRLPRDPVPADVRHHAMNAILREIEAARFRTARYAPVRAAETEPMAEREAPQRVKRTPGSRRGLPRPRAVVGVVAAIAVGAAIFVTVQYRGDTSVVGDSLSGTQLPQPATLLRGRLLAHNGSEVWVAEGSEPQVVKITSDTQILRGDAPGTLDGAPRGATTEALGTLELNGDFDAVVVRVRDGSTASATAAP